jgi:glycosyltransferase involved in cell wall biosynthesis
MKICILQPYLAPYRLNLFDNIGMLNKDETIICYYSKFEKRRKWEENYTLTYCKEVFFNSFIIQTGYEKNIEIPNLVKILSFLIKEKPDVIVCFPNIFGLIILIMDVLFKYKLISWLESTKVTESNTGYLKRKIRDLFWNKTSTFIVPGNETKDYLNSMGFPKNHQKLYFVPNSVNSEFQIKSDELEKKFNNINKTLDFCFSGSLILRKGIDLLLEAIKIVNKEYNGKRKYNLNILGTGEFQVEQIDNVIWHGFQTGDSYIKTIMRSNVFILPSRSDCNPLTVIEALKSGCILVLSKNVGNASDFIQDNGFLIDDLSPRGISRYIISLLECSTEKLQYMSNISFSLGKNITQQNSAKKFISALSDTCF